MVVLMIGDVVGQSGCDYLEKKLADLKRKHQPDVVIANGENSAVGNGITPKSAKHLFGCGVDVITTGNHVLRRKEIYEQLDREDGIIRPANYHHTAPGKGVFVYDKPGLELCVISLQGVVFMQNLQNPFDCIDELLKKIETKCIVVDFHAEATAEKQAMGYYLDGRVSAVVGTHTHIPTADARILPKGTGYITDVGMVGGRNSVLGVKTSLAIEKIRTGLPVKFEEELDDICMSAVLLEIDNKTGVCQKIKAITMF